jgi:murein DD-endopeptidase MepM/ murein hydrolase activator NlpD
MLAKLVLPMFAVGVVAAVAGAPVSRVPAGQVGSAAPTPVPYAAPLPEPLQVLRGFAPPATRYGPGHLGVDLRADTGAVVRSAGPGVVRFAGTVAGRGVVVVAHPQGVTTEYEPVRPMVRTGARVRAGTPVGILHGRHTGCPGGCLHWGARRDDRYIDPLDLLRPLGPVVLLPWTGPG